MYRMLAAGDPKIDDIIPGVMTLENGQQFQHVKLVNGSRDIVAYTDHDVYTISDGTFEANSKKVIKTSPDGQSKVCSGWKD